MKKELLLLGAAVLALAMFFTACKKDETETNADVQTTEDLVSNLDYDEVADYDEDQIVAERGGGGSCPTLTTTQPWGVWPNTLTVDFGTSCTRPDGRVLSGKVIITQSDSTLRVFGATRTVTYDNFFVDGVQVEGSKTLTNNGLNANLQWSYTKSVDKTLTFPDGDKASWKGTVTRTLVEGGLTFFNILDDVWSVTGSGSGKNRDGHEFTVNIAEPLIKRNACRWISDGSINWTRDGSPRTLDYGDGSCDRLATLTLADGSTYTIRLRN